MLAVTLLIIVYQRLWSYKRLTAMIYKDISLQDFSSNTLQTTLNLAHHKTIAWAIDMFIESGLIAINLNYIPVSFIVSFTQYVTCLIARIITNSTVNI